MALKILRLEKRILFDAAVAAAVASVAVSSATSAAAKNTADATASPDHPATTDTASTDTHAAAAPQDTDIHAATDSHATADSPSGMKVLVISSKVTDYQYVVNSVQGNVKTVVYDPAKTTLSALADQIKQTLGGEQASSIAFANEGNDGIFYITQNVFVTKDTLQSNTSLKTFWADMGSLIQEGGRVDLLSCSLAQSGTDVVDLIHSYVDSSGHNVDVAASANMTGFGGDWNLEVGGVNALTYFDAAKIDAWDGRLNAYNVINTNNSGAGSLSQAITDANNNPGADQIYFFASGTFSSSSLPSITDPVTINGLRGFIVIDGSGVGSSSNGLTILSGGSNSTIIGLAIQNFSQNGVSIISASDVTLQDCDIGGNGWNGVLITQGSNNVVLHNNHIGTDSTGSLAMGNTLDGVLIDTDSNSNYIGGSGFQEGNLISANGQNGVHMIGSTVSLNSIFGNTIGLDVTKTVALGNGANGIYIESSAHNNFVGQGADTANVISGNSGSGVLIRGASFNEVQSNIIGTNASGSTGLGNALAGVWIDAASTNNQIDQNIISGNEGSGIQFTLISTNNSVLGNYIGLDSAGTSVIANGGDGISIDASSSNFIGGSAPGDRNYISGNAGNGLLITDGSSFNSVFGNTIGLNVNGTIAGNSADGILIAAGAHNNFVGQFVGSGNIISGNTKNGVEITGDPSINNDVQFNWIGLDNTGAGAAANGGDGLLLTGGSSLTNVTDNVISGNSKNGVHISDSQSNTFTNNWIGPAAFGGGAVANGGDGVLVEGASFNNDFNSSIGPNVISGNKGNGVELLLTTGQVLYFSGNYVGTDLAGVSALGNEKDGILMNQASFEFIGKDNVISGNALNGIEILGVGAHFANGNLIQNNFIGVDVAGQFAVPNGGDGVLISGSASFNDIRENLISGNAGNGVEILGDGTGVTNNNYIVKNFIGLDSNGNYAIQNGGDGVLIKGGAQNNLIGEATISGLGNFISGNRKNGIEIEGTDTTGNTVEQNYIGLDVTGLVAIGNQESGVLIDEGAQNNTIGGSTSDSRNVISGNLQYGVKIQGAATNTVENNYIGTDVSGAVALGNSFDGISIDEGASGNLIQYSLISGNGWSGVHVSGTDSVNNVIQFNQIGLKVKGDGSLGNGANGVIIESYADGTQIFSNIISGNTANGIEVAGVVYSTRIAANIIGLDPFLSTAFGNGQNGVLLLGGPKDTIIGSAVSGENNVISANGGNGVMISGFGSDNNSVYNNIIGLGEDAFGNTLGMGNALDGVKVDSGALGNIIGSITAPVNVISANLGNGIHISSAGYVSVYNNYIGIDSSATIPFGNGNDGILIDAGSYQVGVGAGSGAPANIIAGNIHNGVEIKDSTTSEIVVSGNYIGFDNISFMIGNGGDGVLINAGANSNTIGGRNAGDGNFISGNAGNGVHITGSGTRYNTVLGNVIGLTSTNTALGNALDGVLVDESASLNYIGDYTNAGNFISGNLKNGVHIKLASENYIRKNYIGLDTSGTFSIANGADGVLVEVQATLNEVAGNTISGNSLNGVEVYAGKSNLIIGNIIGMDATGSFFVGNKFDGILLDQDSALNTIGGNAVGEGNLISGNGANGVHISGITTTDNKVYGNMIGLNFLGSPFYGNAKDGVLIDGSSSRNYIGDGQSGAGNVIAGNLGNGVEITDQAHANYVLGNFIGTDAGGNSGIGNRKEGVLIDDGYNNQIGGSGLGEGNVISGNLLNGVHLTTSLTSGNEIKGNFIGSDPSGAAALSNGINGVLIDAGAINNTVGGDATTGEGNVISGNKGDGVHIEASSSNRIQGNIIGLDSLGTLSLGQQLEGVVMEGGASNNDVGGEGAGNGNIISGNNGDGVHITGSGTDQNRVFRNSIGFDKSGLYIIGNSNDGVLVDNGAKYNEIGSVVFVNKQPILVGNTITGNEKNGVEITGLGTDYNIVQGNMIGLNAVGTLAGYQSSVYGNQNDGVLISDGASYNTVGGKNVISANWNSGVEISSASNNEVSDNIIGLDVTGSMSADVSGYFFSNYSGVSVNNGSQENVVINNAISNNFFWGVGIFDSKDNTVAANKIGVDSTGLISGLGNTFGVLIDSLAIKNTVGSGNVISGNLSAGVFIEGVNNVVEGNIIGLNASSTSAIPNGDGSSSAGGVVLQVGSLNKVQSNTISGNDGAGVRIFGGVNNVVHENNIGLDATGTFALPNTASGVIIRSSSSNQIDSNRISGNDDAGVYIFGGKQSSQGNLILQNLIGVNAFGNSVPNANDGVFIDGNAGQNIMKSNTISYNGSNGVHISEGFFNSLIGNEIAFNTKDGVLIDLAAKGNFVFADTPSSGNSIHDNGGYGVHIASNAVDTMIVFNSIYNNGNLGIKLEPGSNNDQVYPTLVSAVVSGHTLTITWVLDSPLTPSAPFALQFFANDMVDPSGFGEGRYYLATDSTVATDATGHASGVTIVDLSSVSIPSQAKFITATATDLDPNTSEFSRAIEQTGPQPPPTPGSEGLAEPPGPFFSENFNIFFQEVPSLPALLPSYKPWGFLTVADVGQMTSLGDYVGFTQLVAFGDVRAFSDLNAYVGLSTAYGQTADALHVANRMFGFGGPELSVNLEIERLATGGFAGQAGEVLGAFLPQPVMETIRNLFYPE